MFNETVTLPSGRELVLQAPDFALANRLRRAIAKELAATKIEIALPVGPAAFARALDRDFPANDLKNVLCGLLGSEEIETILAQCMATCLYNGTKISSPGTFEEDKQARADYLPIAWEVIRFSLAPFFEGLASKLSTLAPPAAASPR